jgi:hypothetical protein
MLVAAVWLIALGLVFLVQQLSGWSWEQAWPLFIIFIGVGTTASVLLDSSQWRGALWAIWWPLAILAVGIVLLLSTTGSIGILPAELWSWWPALLVALGVWFVIGAFVAPGRAPAESLAVPLAGASEADVRIGFGGGELSIQPAEPGVLVGGSFEGGVEQRSSGPGQIELRPPGGSWTGWWDRPLRWRVGLTAEVPVHLRLDTGANRSTIDLSELRIQTLELKTGASETRVLLPRQGVTTMRTESGVAAVDVEVPAGVAARIHSRMALGTTRVDERRFPRTADGYSSPDFDTAPNRVDIDISGGVGAVTVS